jgi:hypothetical protein
MFWEHTLINLYIDILVSSIYRFLPSLHFLAEPGEAQKSLLQLINDFILFILFSPYDNILLHQVYYPNNLYIFREFSRP